MSKIDYESLSKKELVELIKKYEKQLRKRKYGIPKVIELIKE